MFFVPGALPEVAQLFLECTLAGRKVFGNMRLDAYIQIRASTIAESLQPLCRRRRTSSGWVPGGTVTFTSPSRCLGVPATAVA